MITAPNSLIPLAHIMMLPAIMLRQARGNEIRTKVFQGDAPSVRATFSSRGSTF